MPLVFTHSYLADSLSLFRQMKSLGDRAMAQVTAEGLYWSPGPESNSIAIIVKHMAGNMRSRWTDFLTSDGEKPDRGRDTEFVDPPATREELLAIWENGWHCLFSALEPLTDGDLTRTVTIRGEAHSVMQAIHRQVSHCSYHVGQIVFLARQVSGEHWQTLSVPKGGSTAFNQKVASGEASQR
jgi:hypothetical protein